ncbi:hypothetical protein LG409_17255 [Halomonas sp. NyZ770]|uniref:hypothetical protein n=1 Tax=Halomonas sp. NyZ770 TaxID=2883106 RepID=UPI001D0B9A4B|nr:hypothetical protein [Halomonas sp. NyZ770]UDM07087.1 hypothetical protein LG409_17255 [Halomonas sp. NyZ770]
MQIINEVLRAHVLPGIIGIHKTPQLTFRGWIAKERFKITSQINSKDFILNVYSHDELLLPYAYDINRMAASSFESIHGISPDESLPRSVGWLIIRAYYSAYFSAHAILRLFGISCSQLDSNETRAITDVAQLYSLKNDITISNGYYKCIYNHSNSTITCTKLNNTHQDVWKLFYDFLNDMATKIATSDFRQADRDLVLRYLFKLREGLSHKNTLNGGNWLSKIRNEVNYSHSMGAWYPYQKKLTDHEEMFRLVKQWKSPPTEHLIEKHIDKSDHLLYIGTCVSIISLCRSLLADLKNINSDIFLKHAPIRLINQIEGT